MKLLFSEATPDYQRYVFPYAIWAFPEAGETPADFFAAGFLPSTRELNRFYLARQIRVRLAGFKASSENRRVLRKCGHLKMTLLESGQWALTEERRRFCQAYAETRFGGNALAGDRLDALFRAPVATHLLLFSDEKEGTEAGYVVLYLEPPGVAYFYYSFYDLRLFERNLGLYIMTSAVRFFAEQGFEYLYLGTCYSERALYKTQFSGCEFFNGMAWSTDLRELKFLVARQTSSPAGHLLEDAEYLQAFQGTSPAALAAAHGFRVKPSAQAAGA